MDVKVTTVRHKDCYLLLPPNSTSLRCGKCIHHRASLQVQAKRMLDASSSTQSKTASSSHANYRYLSRSELIDRLGQEHHQRQLISKQCQRLKARLEQVSEKGGIYVDKEMHDGLREIMQTESSSVLQSLPSNSFKVCVYAFVLCVHEMILCKHNILNNMYNN